MSQLVGQVAVITGGSSGIGYAIASELLEKGMVVVLTARNKNRLEKAEQKLKGGRGSVFSISADVSKAKQVQSLFEKVKRKWGRVDLLVNNAGVGRLKTIGACEEAEWDEVLDINLKGVFLCTKYVLPLMKKQRSGYVVNISSVAGKTGFGGAAAYSSSKFGVVGLTESFLEEAIPYHIKATVICPAYVATPMVRGVSVPQKEMIPPEDIGKMVAWLLDLSPYTVIPEIVVQRKGSIGT